MALGSDQIYNVYSVRFNRLQFVEAGREMKVISCDLVRLPIFLNVCFSKTTRMYARMCLLQKQTPLFIPPELQAIFVHFPVFQLPHFQRPLIGTNRSKVVCFFGKIMIYPQFARRRHYGTDDVVAA